MSETKEIFNLVWFTTNLRTQDNRVLHKAITCNKPIIACYCFDPRHFKETEHGFKKTGQYRAKFLIESVKNLKNNLSKLNIQLFTYIDRPEVIIPSLVNEYCIDHVFVQKEFTSEETTTFKWVQNKLETTNITQIFDQFLYEPSDVFSELNQIPKVFTVFRKHVEKKLTILPSTETKSQEKVAIKNPTKIPTLNELGFTEFTRHPKTAFPFKGGETEANKRLNYYVFESQKIGVYKKTRNGLVGPDYSSKLSPWLANGSISSRTIYWAVKEFEKTHFKNQSTYWLIFELIWRDFFKYVAIQHGNAIFKTQGISNKDHSWSQDKHILEAWQNGKTTDNFVNANMLELNKTGWMSNRGRQNVASFFVRTLQLDWRIGAAYFESLLIDYDVHSNYGNWMYVAGVGNDPRDRVFNTKLQADRYDPHGKFQKQWLQTELFT
ncbi:DASH family cryptochrome [Hanstruepera flava]|uniref:DASH family cryptochrome n=1 Tax=Hanstruepera flava TaxID=2930218 RepID=UPI002028DAD9|nr:DASH family cryptochrome [Hanstruepera flava]